MIDAPILALNYYRRGWLSPGKFIAAVGVLRDLELTASACHDPARLVDARSRLATVRKTLTDEQFDLVTNFVQDANPSSWAKLNGLAQRDGLPKLRAALARLTAIYVEDDTE